MSAYSFAILVYIAVMLLCNDDLFRYPDTSVYIIASDSELASFLTF